jgi:hypothetical protein
MAGGTNVSSKIRVASLGREEHKIPGRKTKRSGRTKRSRRSFDEVCLDNADALIDGGTDSSCGLAWIIHDFAGEKRKGALKD